MQAHPGPNCVVKYTTDIFRAGFFHITLERDAHVAIAGKCEISDMWYNTVRVAVVSSLPLVYDTARSLRGTGRRYRYTIDNGNFLSVEVSAARLV